MIQDTAEIVSLVLTSPTIFLGFWVVVMFYRHAIDAIRSNERTPIQWFALGVTIGFVGSVVDNAYWGIAWSLHYMEWESAGWWFQHGVFSNIPFRQLAGVVAAYCHVRCGFEYHDGKPTEEENQTLTRVLLWSIALGVAGIVVLGVIR